MIKTIAFFKRKTGLSREEFARHYETVHVPLAIKYLPKMKGYVRNHITVSCEMDDLDFDCISEFWYENMDEFQKVIDFLQSGSSQAIHEDEESFMERGKSVFFFVNERTSKTPDLASPREIDIDNTVKMMVLSKRKPGISYGEYVRYFEEVCIPALLKNSFGLRACVRNYARLLPDQQVPLFDCITEMWYEKKEAFTAGMRMWEEEGSHIEHLDIKVLPVNEYVSIRTN